MTTGYNVREGSQMLAERIKPDPPRRRDGRCAQCRKPMREPKMQRGVPEQYYAGDPFCSGECCRRWHGIPDVIVLTHGLEAA